MVGPAAGDVTAGVRGRGSLGDADEAMPSWQRCWTQGVCGASWRMHASNACSWRRSACHGWPSVMHLRVSPTRVDASDGSERDYAADARVPKNLRHNETRTSLTPATARCRDPDAAAIPHWPERPPQPHRLPVGAWVAGPSYRRRAACDPTCTGDAAATARAYRLHLPRPPRRQALHRSTACRTRRRNHVARPMTMQSALAHHASSETRCRARTPAVRN